MDFAMALALLFAVILLISAAASAVATFLLLRYCLSRRITTTDDSESPPSLDTNSRTTKKSNKNQETKHSTIQETLLQLHKYGSDGGGGEVRRCTWPEVEALTGGFAEAAVVGRGGFSTVYLARLGDGSAAAVKVLQRCGGGERLLRAFRQELDLLRRLRHPHIVRLLAYSDDHEEEGALVLEYLPDGSLADRLHNSGSRPPLTWPRRMRILYELAGALEHLHDASDTPVVHGDVTAANVLLDDGSGGARLCDFGSARAGFSAAVAASAAAVGSPGYADPFFLRTGIVSKKSDVYSFGVVALETITGLPAVGSDGGKNLTARILPRVRMEGVGGLVDPGLGEEYDVAEAGDVARIAVECVGPQPGLRPAMAQVCAAIGEKAARSIAAVDRRSNGLDLKIF